MSRQSEKIARMVGKTTYKDFREGFAGVSFLGDSDADIKHALGVAQRNAGPLAVQVLELHYAMALRHEMAIRKAWDRHLDDLAKRSDSTRSQHIVAKQRMAAALAVRQFAGAKMIQLEVAKFAWTVNARRCDIDEQMRSCTAWLEALRGEAEREFLEAMSIIKPGRRAA